MGKVEKLIQKVLQNRSISYSDAERLLKNLGFEVISCGSHHVFRKKGYSKNISIKKRPQLLPYQIRDVKEVLRDHGY
ncbi:type II toxin-antitoxin system HicA family toxin [Candidatus Neptunochlamydia vexilliferae]